MKYSEVLDELAKLQKLTIFFDKNDQSYPYWNKWKWMAKKWGMDPKKLWSAVKTHRQPMTRLQFSNTEGFNFYMKSPAALVKSLHELDMNLGGMLQTEELIPREQKQMYLVSSLMEEAIASSQLEGAATTRKVAKEMLEANRKPQSQGEQMIVNNYEAMKWIVANRHKHMTVENILAIHSILTRDTLVNPEDTGQFRKDDEVKVADTSTGNVIYTPPSHVHLKKLMQDFCRFANDKDTGIFFVHPISKAIIIHFLMGCIHPFADGNGRTARTLFYWYLLKKNYWLIKYMSVSRVILNSKSQYAQAYLHTELDGNDLTYFLLYNVKAIATALQDLKNYIKRKNEEKKLALALLKDSEVNERQIILVNEILQDPHTSFTVLQVQNKMSVSNQTARTDLTELVTRGLLEPRKIGKHIQFFPVADFAKKGFKK